MNFWGKSENFMFLHSLRLSFMFHAKNQKNLSRGFPGKWGKRDRQTDRQRDRQTERDGSNIRVLRTLSLSRQTNKLSVNDKEYLTKLDNKYKTKTYDSSM